MLRICPIQLVFLLIIVSNMTLSSPILRSIFSFVALHLLFFILLQHHISKLFLAFSSIHISDPCRAIL
uniref:Putative secreted protein n=1 Tax=Xenopsylla cheopis TaxID=163159 RepID=A0A6M2DYC2_XENCH